MNATRVMPTDLRTMWNGQIDQAELNKALAVFDVKLPIRIQHRLLPEGMRGAHKFEDDKHTIMLSRTMSHEDANESILHELTHASQVEHSDSPDRFYTMYNMEEWVSGYENNRFEQEARIASQSLKDHIKIAIGG